MTHRWPAGPCYYASASARLLLSIGARIINIYFRSDKSVRPFNSIFQIAEALPNTRIHARTHAYLRTQVHPHRKIHARPCTRRPTRADTYVHILINAHGHTRPYSHTRTHASASAHARPANVSAIINLESWRGFVYLAIAFTSQLPTSFGIPDVTVTS